MADAEKRPTAAAATADASSPYMAPSISLPKGGGAIRGIGEKFAANPVSGTGSMTVPIFTTPGRSNFGPQLSLAYDSGAGNGPFGFGWSLSTPSISRKTDKGLPLYRDDEESDVYLLSGAEDLVPVLRADGSRFIDTTSAPGYSIHRYRPRTEGLFARIERWTNRATGEMHWRSISRENITTRYGTTAESRIADPADPARVFTWLLSESYDAKGNATVYRYAEEDDANVDRTLANERNRVRTANRYLKRILYGNRVSRLVEPDLSKATWLFEVVFDYDEGHYEDLPLDSSRPEAEQHRYVRATGSAARTWGVRPDAHSSHRATFEVRTYRRCHRILMFHHFAELGTEPCLVRSTEFEYNDFDYSRPATIEAELAHQGSTRFASFIQAVTQCGYVRDESRAVLSRDGTTYVTYLKRSLPPLEFEYSKAVIQDNIREVDDVTLENLPAGVDGSAYQWGDLDGEGLAGVLTEQAEAWFYKPNLGYGHLGPLRKVHSRPSPAELGSGRYQLLDLAGDGQLDVVSFSGPTSGFYERTSEEGWSSFQPFSSVPQIAWDDPNLRFVDLNGDGHADVLITEHETFTWYPSLAEEGFGRSITIRTARDEERGPRLVFSDGTQSIYLADMTGHGLTDLVRARNGEICYWPNEGHGRFGPKVTMDDAPWFDYPDDFDQRRLRIADIDGSGTTDIIYLGRDGVRLYFNQAGNRWSTARRLDQFPLTSNVSSVSTTDLLGNGTACLVWSSPLPGDASRPLRFIDLMGGSKPHLLIRSKNGLGAETHVTYGPSTHFYLADKRAGRPWITKLPFPVHVVERVETHDRISGNLFVTRYAYHHGYFDGTEREFNGFALIEQWDTQELGALSNGQGFPTGTNVDETSHVPPVLTRSWFHTGAYVGHERVANLLAGLVAGRDVGSYYREPGLSDEKAAELLLADTILPPGLSVLEEAEACRALKGSLLRQELYAVDATDHATHPYVITEQTHTVRRLQPRTGNRHAVFFAHARESLTYHYERVPSDPRIGHALTLEVDDFGHVKKSVAIGYGRRRVNPTLDVRDQTMQGVQLVTYTENEFTNAVAELDAHHEPLPCDKRMYELTGYTPTGAVGRYQIEDFVDPTRTDPVLLLDGEIQYEDGTSTGRQRRLIEHVRTLYRRDDLNGALALGQLQSLALPFESYSLAYTAGLPAVVYGTRVTDTIFDDDGRYVHCAGDPGWWIPTGQVFYSPQLADTPPEELDYARAHFFLSRRHRDPFHTTALGTEVLVSYDDYDLLLQETVDALGNRITVGERNVDPTQPLVRRGNDYRVQQPALLMDVNRNRSALAFDALGMVVATAMMGKPEELPIPGDRLPSAFRPDLTRAEIDQFLAQPKSPFAASLLGTASSRVVYDLGAYWRDPDPSRKSPTVAVTLARETHASDPTPADGLRIQLIFVYSDGFGREIQKKMQAEPGPVPERDPVSGRIVIVDGRPRSTPNDASPRWVGTGWTVFNNKGKPVRQFEPFFSDTHAFERDVRVGVSPTLFYDPLERIVATLHPNHTWEKIVFDAWSQTTWDTNDTVLISQPKDDEDAGSFFRRLPESDYLPTWYAQREGGALGSAERDAALRTAIHAGTPTVVQFDALGRGILTLAHNRFKRSDTAPTSPPDEEVQATRTVFDVEGNERRVMDARDRVVMRYDYNLVGTRIHQASMESGERWMLNDVANKPLYTWDSRDFRLRTTYDRVRRPTDSFLRPGLGAESLVGRMIYGESYADAEAKNLRGQVVQLFDQAGVILTDRFDFKGNSTRNQRQLATTYRATLDWSLPVDMEPRTYTNSTRYDAFNRPTSLTAPDGSVVRPIYNEANLLERIDTNLRGVTENGQPVWTPFVTDIDYDAKGRRTLIEYGNGARTRYEYDPLAFRLVRMLTQRNPVAFPNDCPTAPDAGWPGCQVQSLRYTYDPAGNVTQIRDEAQQTVYFRNKRVDPSADYTYDSLYRLIEATGREHLGLAGGAPKPPAAPDLYDRFETNPVDPRDGNALGTYLERYVYDGVGNILAIQHRGGDPAHPGWTRTYTYVEPSQLEPTKTNNRLSTTTTGTDIESYHYDGSAGIHGGITTMPGLTLMAWDYRDQLQATSRQAVSAGTIPQTTWYIYGAGGQRIRKVTDGQAAAGQPARARERIYVGGLEIYREYGADGQTVLLERQTLQIMDSTNRIAMVETRIDASSSTPLIRYQIANHLGSAVLELDALARILSYEEYYPFGGTSYKAVDSQIETPRRYRYSGKERDEESGLYYFGARYYASHLGRWIAADPAGVKASLNAYVFVSDRPTSFVDPDGREEAAAEPWSFSSSKPSFGESIIPIWGSIREANYNFDRGNWGWGLVHTALAISDVFLIKSLVTVGGKVIFKTAATKGAAELGAKELAAKEATELAAKELAAKELAAKELAAKELAAKELAAKELAAKELAAKELAAKELAAKELAAKELAAKELAAKELAAKELAAKELAAKELAAKELAAKEAASVGAKESNAVYHSVTAAGKTQYVGITNNLARRAAEHLASKGIKIEPLLTNLSRADARAVEQALIEIHGLGKNTGTLLNKINSIAKTNPIYAEQLKRGYELLKSIGYK